MKARKVNRKMYDKQIEAVIFKLNSHFKSNLFLKSAQIVQLRIF